MLSYEQLLTQVQDSFIILEPGPIVWIWIRLLVCFTEIRNLTQKPPYQQSILLLNPKLMAPFQNLANKCHKMHYHT